MNFVSWAFAVLFLTVFAARLTIGRSKTERPYVMLLIGAGTIFCLWHIPIYIFIMLTTIVTDYTVSILMGRYRQGDRRRGWLLAASVVANLGLLGFFKYGNFVLRSLEEILAWAGHATRLPAWELALPMGISFYTFCSMSYTIDVYRGRLAPVRSFKDLYLFLTFFPHLVAGPIVRADQFLYQLYRHRRLAWPVFTQGCYLLIVGFFLKMVCADNLASAVEKHWAASGAPGGSGLAALMLAVYFSFQIFCDFHGYTCIARGLSYLLGFRLPENFNNPYLATSFSNFWERWHISLSRWLRDYLYLPLGGNRISPRRTYANLLVVMLLGGLWHGAALTFIVWGALHGLFLAGERVLGLRKAGARPLTALAHYAVVQAGVLLAWVFFRSATVTEAAQFLGNMATNLSVTPACIGLARWAPFAVPPLVMHLHGLAVERRAARPLSAAARAVLAAILLATTLSFYGVNNAFIYFQF